MLLCLSKSRIAPVILIPFLILLISCAGGRGTAPKAESPQPAPKAQSPQPAGDPPLAKKYQNIVVFGFETTPGVKRSYPNAAKECRANVISALLMENVFNSVNYDKPGAVYTEGTLLVKANINKMRLVNVRARIWGGAFAGRSFMNLDISLIDAGTNKEVRRKTLNSANNPWAAAWGYGSSDRSLPANMGKSIAKFILSVVSK